MDKALEKINGLKWIPWVGNQYNFIEIDSKMLIVGESHYHDNTKQSIENHNSPNLTREVIEEMAIGRDYYETRIFQNFHKALFRNDEFNSSVFWNLVSFYNFIQRPMNSNKERPSDDDYYNGWLSFVEVVKILKPKTCLFIGNSAANYLDHALYKNSDYSSQGVKWEDCISNAYAKSAILSDKEGNCINLIFIRHTSQMFSWDKWNTYLRKKISSELEWFNGKLIEIKVQ